MMCNGGTVERPKPSLVYDNIQSELILIIQFTLSLCSHGYHLMSDSSLHIVLAQLNFTVGDIEGNCEKMLAALAQAKAEQADCVVFSELATIGYPPEDLLYRSHIFERIDQTIVRLAQASVGIMTVVGTPWMQQGDLYNAALVLRDGEIAAQYFKNKLPNYNVFDEKRYFKEGTTACVFDLAGVSVALTICEDIWWPQPIAAAKQVGAELVLNINASPFHSDKQLERTQNLRQRVAETGLPIACLNQTGGQDELVFDGQSFAINPDKEVVFLAQAFTEGVYSLEFDCEQHCFVKQTCAEPVETNAAIYQALTYGLQDYVRKNGFKGGLIGLSGGIDSAVALTLAVDALGPERVHAVMMPSPYTSQMSLDDAAELAANLGVRYSVISIESLYDQFLDVLAGPFVGAPADTTEENIQARIRGLLLMALSNKTDYMLFSTGNKSEMAVGYATLYGDMAGGFAPLKDVLKTRVFALANYKNDDVVVIPQRIIDRPPSAELAPDQKDEDSLPPYSELDRILELFIEYDFSRKDIVDQGFDPAIVSRVINMVLRSEYKRRQAPPGVKVSKRSFGRDRRYPITSGALNYLKD